MQEVYNTFVVKKIVIGGLIFVVIIVVAWFVSYYPIMKQSAPAPQTTDNTVTNPSNTPIPTPALQGEAAIKAYASQQFNIPVSSLKVVSSTKQQWPDTCLGIGAHDKSCIDEATSGYEMTFAINGQQITYRGTENGAIIRIVKK